MHNTEAVQGSHEFRLFANDGRLVSQSAQNLGEGFNQITLHHGKLGTGLYVLQIAESDLNVIAEKFILGN